MTGPAIRIDEEKAAPQGHATMSSAMPDAVNYHRWLLDVLRANIDGGSLLEIGPGYGQYTKIIAGWVDRLVAFDISADCVAGLSRVAGNVEGRVGDPTKEDFVDKAGQARFDSAVCLNVLEHVEQDVVALKNIGETLRPGGELMLLVPAHPRLYGPMDSFAGHFRRYTRTGLRTRLVRAGFERIRLRYFNPIGGLGWWVNARFLKPKTLSDESINRQIMVFDRYVLPASRFVDPLTRRFFGQSLWAIASRPQ